MYDKLGKTFKPNSLGMFTTIKRLQKMTNIITVVDAKDGLV